MANWRSSRPAMTTLGMWVLIALVLSAAVVTLPVFATPVLPDSSAPAVTNCAFSYECQLSDENPRDPIPNVHCAVCKNETACERCAPGYALHKPSGACLSCVAHCLDECNTDSDPLECSECEDGHVRAVYKNWEDPPMSSFSLVGYEESVRCYLPRIYCFSCEVGNCAPGQCKPTEFDTKFKTVGGKSHPGGCTKCPASDSLPIGLCLPDDESETCYGPEPYMCSLPDDSCTNCPGQCINTSQPFCNNCPRGYTLMHDDAGVANACARCGPHCTECEPNQPSNCTYCFDGFHIVNGSCVSNTEGCADGCLECSSAGSCDKCKDELVLDSDRGLCMNRNCTVAGCHWCMYDKVAPGKDLCFWCKSGFYKSDMPAPETGHSKCIPCPQEGCDDCGRYPAPEGTNCTSCLPGYYEEAPGYSLDHPFVTCIKCEALHCDECSSEHKDACFKCSAGFVQSTVTWECIAEADMIPCEERECGIQCESLYFQRDDCTCEGNQTCHRKPEPLCPEHCEECEGSVCKACVAGYLLTEARTLSDGKVLSPQSCDKPCMDHCRGCENDSVTGGKICYDCSPGYFWDEVLLACQPA